MYFKVPNYNKTMLLEVNALLENGTGGVMRAKDTWNLILIKKYENYIFGVYRLILMFLAESCQGDWTVQNIWQDRW